MKVARTVLRRVTLGNRCHLSDRNALALANASMDRNALVLANAPMDKSALSPNRIAMVVRLNVNKSLGID